MKNKEQIKRYKVTNISRDTAEEVVDPMDEIKENLTESFKTALSTCKDGIGIIVGPSSGDAKSGNVAMSIIVDVDTLPLPYIKYWEKEELEDKDSLVKAIDAVARIMQAMDNIAAS